MWEVDISKALLLFALSIAFSVCVDIYVAKKVRSDEEAELLALRFNLLGTLIGIASIGSAGGISFSGYAPQVVLFSLGSPISINFLFVAYDIQRKLIQKKKLNKQKKKKK